MDDLKGVRDQGREALKHNKDNTDKDGNPVGGARLFSEHDCPYGPGAARDAWIAGFGGAEEEVRQVNTSTASSDDVRTETAETVREGAKPKGKGKAKNGKGNDAADANRTAVTTDVTGTGETALKTTVAAADPTKTDEVPSRETTLGDPSASTHPAAVQHVDDATGRTDGAPENAAATGQAVKPADLM